MAVHEIKNPLRKHFGLGLTDVLIPTVLAVLVVVIYQFNFLLFHSLAELFAVVIAILTMVVAWYMYPFTRNGFLMYLGCGYFWLGILDILHTLAYEGMFVFEAGGSNLSVQYWIGTRFIEAGILLTAPWFLKHTLNRVYAFFAFMTLSLILMMFIQTGNFPAGFVEGHGLTTFKVSSEYVIIAVLALAIAHMWHQRQLIEQQVINLLILSIVFTMAAELAFTFYISVYGFSNMIGHIFKVFSYWLIFLSVIRTTLQKPFLAMSRSATTYDVIPDATVVVDSYGEVRQANQSAARLAGLEMGQLVGSNCHDLFHPHVPDKGICPICQSMRSGDSSEIQAREYQKESKWFVYTHAPINELHGLEGTVEVIRDITNKVEERNKLSKLTALKNTIVENLPMMLFVKEAGTNCYVEWNKAAEDMTGQSKESMLGHTDFEFWPEEEAEFFIKKDKEVLDGGELLEIPQEPLTTKSGVIQLHTKKIPIYDDKGEASYLLGISEDITEKLQAEELFRHSQKMDALGNITGGVAHDYNNTLGVILGFSELILKDDLDRQTIKNFAEQIHNAGERGVKLTQQLLSTSKMKLACDELVNVNTLLQEDALMLEKTLTARIELALDLEPKLWDVYLDKNDLEDSILNLSINAMHAIEGAGRYTIATRNEVLDEYDAHALGLEPGEYVNLVFSDTGSGMTKEIVDKVFEPFFTTKKSQGTGLGLSQVYGFVQRSRGGINILSTPGHGSRFSIYLPRVNHDAGKLTEQITRDEDSLAGDEAILLVDDESALLELSRLLLAESGYSVTAVNSSEKALSALSERQYDLVISDVIMPGMSGFELSRLVARDYPNTKLQLISGFSDNLTEEVEPHLREGLLKKPFSREEFLTRVRQVLDS